MHRPEDRWPPSATTLASSTDAAGSSSSHRARDDVASWLVREMARAAELPASGAVADSSIAEAIDQCAQLLSRFWPGVADPSEAAAEPAAHDQVPELAPGTRLGRFEVRRWLGHGGFGVVFLVFDSRLEREAALKIPRPEILFSSELRHRFLRDPVEVPGEPVTRDQRHLPADDDPDPSGLVSTHGADPASIISPHPEPVL